MSELADYDVLQLHRLLLLRDPETPADVEGRRGRSLDQLLREFAGSGEFRTNLQASVRARRLPVAPAWLLPSAGAAGWAATALPLTPSARSGVAAAAGWVDLLARIFADESFRLEIEAVNPAAGSEAFASALAGYAQALEGRTLAGGVDAASPEQVLGWAVDRTDLATPLHLELRVDGELRARTHTHLFRRDLQDALGGSGRYAFAFLADEDGGARFGDGAKLEVREERSGLLVGEARIDAAPEPGPIGRFQEDVDRARRALAWLERRANELGTAATFPLSEYTAWARAYGGDTPRTERQRAQRAAGLEGRAAVSLLVSPPEAPLDLQPLLDSLERQEAPGWTALFACAPSDEEAVAALVGLSSALVRSRCQVLPGATRADLLSRAPGDHLLLLEGGDTLPPDALHRCLHALGADPRPRLLFGDDDRFRPAEGGGVLRFAPRLRAAFDPDLLLQGDALGPVLCVERRALKAALSGGGSLEPARRRDLALRLLEELGEDGVRWAGGMLAHLREGGEAARLASAPPDLDGWEAETRSHLARIGSTAQTRLSPSNPGHGARTVLRIRHALPEATASIIIPTRDRLDLLGPCLQSIERSRPDNRTRLEVIVVDNGSREAETLRRLEGEETAGRLRVVRSDRPFNFAALNNLGASQSAADLLVLLNNDVEVLTADWLDALARHALRPEVGVVGARLVYDDLTIQHAGVVTGGVHAFAAHEAVGEPIADGGHLGRRHQTRRAAAVTGACLAVRREVWERLGGLDAARFAVDGNDIDFCLRVREAGLAVLYTPDATLFHHESKSRGFGARQADSRWRGELEAARLRERWGAQLTHDPFYNPVFDRAAPPFQRLGPPPTTP